MSVDLHLCFSAFSDYGSTVVSKTSFGALRHIRSRNGSAVSLLTFSQLHPCVAGPANIPQQRYKRLIGFHFDCCGTTSSECRPTTPRPWSPARSYPIPWLQRLLLSHSRLACVYRGSRLAHSLVGLAFLCWQWLPLRRTNARCRSSTPLPRTLSAPRHLRHQWHLKGPALEACKAVSRSSAGEPPRVVSV